MPIGVALGTAAATVGAAKLSSDATKSAAKKAATVAETGTANSNALTREVYGQNMANLSPFMARGNEAGSALNALLLGAPQVPAQAPQQPMGYAGGINPLTGYPGGPQAFRGYASGEGFAAPDLWMSEGMLALPGAHNMQYGNPMPLGQPQGMVPSTVQAQVSPWDQFRNSTNYQFRLNEGMKGLNQGYAARGMLESGAAMRGITRYGQEFASNELGNYMNMLAGQQGVGLSGANALAGVGTNMVGAITANNNALTGTQANAALVSGAAQGQMYGGIANALGNFAGSFGSSYGSPRQPQASSYIPGSYYGDGY